MRPPAAAVPRGQLLSLPRDVSAGAVVLAVTLPVVFLHVRFQPAVALGSATFKLSDALVLLTALTAAAAAVRHGLAVLRPGIPVWMAGIALFLWIGAAVFYPLLSSHAYPWRTHLVTAGELAEYALLAPAVPLLIRRRTDALLALGTLVAWSLVATIVGVLQWTGWNIAAGWGQGHREPSLLGTQDFAAFSGMVLGLGIVSVLWGVRGRLRIAAWTAIVSGLIGFVLGGATSGVVGLVPAVAIAAAVAYRRGLARRAAIAGAVAATVLASLGVVVYRSGDFGQFFSFLGVKQASAAATTHIETYPQHTLLAYIGLRIWLHHPVVGAGFEASKDYATFGRELPAAHARFPHVAPTAFPSRTRLYGVQDVYVQALADLGIVGLLLLLGLFGAGIWPALVSALRGPAADAFTAVLGVFWLILWLGLSTAQGIIAGIPLDAIMWLGFAAVVTRPSSVVASMAKVLVTGGAGFIGSNLVRALLERGDDVRVLDNFSTGNRANLAGLDVEIVEGELRSYERVHNAVRGSEVVYHLGALGSVPRSVQDPLTSSAVNVEGTLNVLLAARDEGVRRVVFSSSSSVYGAKRELPVQESLAADPISPYGVAKLAAERYCVSFSRVYESFESVVLRYFNVFGPRQSPFSQYAAMVPLFMTAIAAGEQVTIFGDGEQSRDFTYVDNVVDATLRSAQADGASGRIFNVAAGSPASVNAVADAIGHILGKPVERAFAPPRPGDIRDSWADISAARDVLGYTPSVDLEQGLRRTIEHLGL